MGREIKFRAWDTGKRLLNPKDTDGFVHTERFHIKLNGELFDSNLPERTITTDDLILEMFTGLKDKNGKEIYEGDIFKFKFLENLHKPIELIGQFTFGSDLSFEIDVIGDESYVCMRYIDNGQFYDFEVIGNIHENENLVTQ